MPCWFDLSSTLLLRVNLPDQKLFVSGSEVTVLVHGMTCEHDENAVTWHIARYSSALSWSLSSAKST